MLHPDTGIGPLLMIVAKAVAAVPTLTERLDGNTAASSAVWVPVWVKVADTLCAWFIVTAQLPIPPQAPPQPVKEKPLAGAAVSITWALPGKPAEQVAPQLIPAGE